MLKEMPKEVDFSSLEAFFICQKKYYFRIVRELVRKECQLAPEFGRCIHLALDSWYTGKDEKKAIEIFKGSYKEDLLKDKKRTIAVGEKLLSLYFTKYKDQNMKVLKSETFFQLPIEGVTDVGVYGRMDKIMDWDGVICVMDHKTTTRLGPEYFKKLKPNAQFMMYVYAARKLGFNVGMFLLDVLLVAKGLLVPAQLSKLTPLARDMVDITEEDIKDFLSELRAAIEMLKRCFKEDTWLMTGAFSGGCTYYGECPYRSICKEEKAIQERIIAQDYIVSPWTPKQEEEVE